MFDICIPFGNLEFYYTLGCPIEGLNISSLLNLSSLATCHVCGHNLLLETNQLLCDYVGMDPLTSNPASPLLLHFISHVSSFHCFFSISFHCKKS